VDSERRSADTRTKILEVAEREFAARGYEGAHLQRIASQVGVQKTALYYYFASKASLYEAVLLRMLEGFDARVRDALERGGGPEARMERLLDGLNDLLAERPHYSKVLIRLFVDPPPVEGERVLPLVRRVVGRVLEFYREGVDAGAFVAQSSRHTFQSVLGAVVFHYASGGFGAGVLGVDDLFTARTVAWRREEARRLLLRATLAGGDGKASGPS
jgi:TetR/AcrR family transcriptional regulator